MTWQRARAADCSPTVADFERWILMLLLRSLKATLDNLAPPCLVRARLKSAGLYRTKRSNLQRCQTAKVQAKFSGILADKPARHNIAPQDLLFWYKKAVQHTKTVSEQFKEADDPSCKDLLRELDWLLEDATGSDWPTLRLQLASGSLETKVLPIRLSQAELSRLWDRRLLQREPLQYITHAAHWRDLVLSVGPGVLIPRPESECLVDFAQKACSAQPSLSAGPWADLGTGSGALAVGLALSMPELKEIWATDVSPEACHWASANVHAYRLRDRVKQLKGQLCGIISNPPYIQQEVLPTLQAEVRAHEPVSALDGGPGMGLACLRTICNDAPAFLRPGGFIGLETGGAHQTGPVADLLGKSFSDITKRKDMFGVERFVTALRR